MDKNKARVKPCFRPADYPAALNEAARRDVAALFTFLAPDAESPEIDDAHMGIAIAALNPKLALNLAKMSVFMAQDLLWCPQPQLRELAVQAVNFRYHCGYTLRARRPRAESLGLGADVLAAIPDWQSSSLFSAAQRQIIAYVNAVISGNVPEILSKEMIDEYGEMGVVELTAAIGWWSMWAMFINALRPDADT
jgi:alkylhydroperoxidase family enzyme